MLIISCEKSNNPEPQSTTPVKTATGTPTGTVAVATIGTSGGSLVSADGKLTVNIPAGALASATEISIQPLTNEAPLGMGAAYRLSPEGLTFAEPVQLVFHYDDNILKQSSDDFLWIVTQATDGSWNAMLKSVPDKNAKTVTIETTHFSDWALGRFIDFVLNPAYSIVKKGQSVQLRLSGFVRDKAISDDDELAPLIPITGDGDGLTPLTPIPPIESRYVSFKVKQWTMNGAAAPVSNSNGALSATGNSATYTAPGKKPSTNPVAISVQVETSNKEGSKATFLITSNISVVDTDLYLLVKVDGQEFEYYEYGLNGSVPPDPNNFELVNCGLDEGRLEIVAAFYNSAMNPKNIFELTFANPAETSRNLIGFNLEGDDNMFFTPEQGTGYDIDYTKRTKNQYDVCELENLCGSIAVTLTTYNGSNTVVRGYFSGTLYEDKPGYANDCKMADTHSISGEFNLMLVN
jgi:hypothetical protein